MQTILHIGLPKTGTTTLQKTFRRSYARLIENAALYPKNPAGSNFASHKILASMIVPERKFGRDLRSLAPDAAALDTLQKNFVETVRTQCADASPDTLVISAEHLGSRHVVPERLEAALKDLGITSPRCVVYTRRPSDHFLSRAQQWIKGSYFLPSYHKPLLDILTPYEEVLGVGSIDVNPFDRKQLVKGDIVEDFCHRYLGSVEASTLERGASANETISAESMDILLEFRKQFFDGVDDKRAGSTKSLFDALSAADEELGATRPVLLPGIADRINYSDKTPLTLRDRFGIEFSDFDYGRLERGDTTEAPSENLPLSQLVVIDRSMRKAILEHLAMSPWAVDDPTVQGWLKRQRRKYWLSKIGIGA